MGDVAPEFGHGYDGSVVVEEDSIDLYPLQANVGILQGLIRAELLPQVLCNEIILIFVESLDLDF